MRLIVVLAIATACQAPDSPGPVAPPAAPARASAKIVPVANLFAASAPTGESAAPWALTASDGSGLALARIEGRAVVEGPLAFTELHLYFHNPEARVREGTFAITLPTGAAVQRFAMEIGGQLVEAEVVEQQLARRAYEDFLHRRQDPALLEKAAGNQFTARVFPIPANADEHLVMSFASEVAPGHYALPLRGLGKIPRVDLRVQVRGTDGDLHEQTLDQRDWVPDRDLVVDGSTLAAPRAIAAGDLVAARVAIDLPNAAEPPAGLTVLIDTSASRALGFAADARRIHALLDEVARRYGGGLPIQLVAFDQDTAALFAGRADEPFDLERALASRGALGASDLGQAIAWLGEHPPAPRIALVTDGVITAGPELADLRAKLRQLPGVERVDVILTGGIRDDAAAAAITQAGLPHTGAVLDLDRGAPEVARRLGLAVRTELAVTADGARDVSPRTILAAQPGDEVTIYAHRDPRGQLAIAIGGAPAGTLAPVAVTPALLERALAAAEIAELDAHLAKATGDAADKLKHEIVARSIAARVVSSQTAMLVLPSDADFATYGIDRFALADILTVGAAGVELTHRTQLAQIARPGPTPEPTVEPRTDPGAPPDQPPIANPTPDLALDMAQTDAGRSRAMAQLSALQHEQSALKQRVSEATVASARAERRQGVRLSQACLDNPLSRACDDGPLPPRPPHVRAAEPREIREPREPDEDTSVDKTPPLAGPLAEIEAALAKHAVDVALAKAAAWHAKDPGDVLALIGLGDALEAKRDLATAARVYGSIIDLYPARADFRRFAGERLERLGQLARALAIDTYRRAVAERPDHLTGHRLLAYALVRDGKLAEAFTAIVAGLDQKYPPNRFLGGMRVLAEDAGIIGAAYVAAAPARRDEVVAALAAHQAALATAPSTRFVMYWETDDNDVDFHIRDARGGHAWYRSMELPSGGALYADITTGYGPECFTIPGAPSAAPYHLSINYYSQGPMGYGMGLLQILRFDGKGALAFDDRPYVIMTAHAFVDLGAYP